MDEVHRRSQDFWVGVGANHTQWRHQKFSNGRDFLWDKDTVMEDQKPGCGLSCNLDFAKDKDLNQKFKRFPKLSELGDVVSKLV